MSQHYYFPPTLATIQNFSIPMQVKTYALIFLAALAMAGCNSKTAAESTTKDSTTAQKGNPSVTRAGTGQTLDTAKYNQLMKYIANGDTTGRWPVKNAPLPLPGAIFPFNRVVAYYGNLQS